MYPNPKATKYLPGISDALAAVAQMDRDQLVEHMRALYGTNNLKFEATMDEIRAEAARQTRLEFLNPEHVDFREHRKALQP